MDAVKPDWEPDSNATTCHGCNMNFTLFKRKHHCRRCGMVYCDDCTKTRVDMPELGYSKPQRICEQCYKINPSFYRLKSLSLSLRAPMLHHTVNNPLLRFLLERRSKSETHPPEKTEDTEHPNNTNTNTTEEHVPMPDLIAYVHSWNVVALKTQLAVRGPISKRMRTLFWTALTDKLAGTKKNYNSLNKSTSAELAASIETDADRTFSERPAWKLSTMNAVRNILSSFHNTMPDVGYQQGMSYIVVILCLYLDEEHAYWLFVYMMEHLGVKTLFVHTNQYVELFNKALKKYLPHLNTHFETNELSAEVFTMSWLRTLFAQQFELNFVVRVWDLFLIDGFNFAVKIVLALLYKHQEALKALDYTHLMKYLQDLPQQVSGDDNVVTELITLTTQFDFDEKPRRDSGTIPQYFHPYSAQFAIANVKWW